MVDLEALREEEELLTRLIASHNNVTELLGLEISDNGFQERLKIVRVRIAEAEDH